MVERDVRANGACFPPSEHLLVLRTYKLQHYNKHAGTGVRFAEQGISVSSWTAEHRSCWAWIHQRLWITEHINRWVRINDSRAAMQKTTETLFCVDTPVLAW